MPLLNPDEPAPYEILHSDGVSPFLFTADHAGRYIPRSLDSLGVPESELSRHIAWDIGIAGVSRLLAHRTHSYLILQPYSRLVIDCNRPPEAASSIVALSEHTEIPGNQSLTDAEREERRKLVFEPYHAQIEAELARRERSKQPTVLVTMHSFTPSFKGVGRIWQAGVLYNRDSRLALKLRELLLAEGLVVGDNQPYQVSDETDYAIPRYGEQRGLLHVELEIRQDLIADPEGQERWCDILYRTLPKAVASLLT